MPEVSLENHGLSLKSLEIIPGYPMDYPYIIPKLSFDFLDNPLIFTRLSLNYPKIIPQYSQVQTWIIAGFICHLSKQKKASYCYLKLFDHMDAGVHKIFVVWYPTFFLKNLSYEMQDCNYQKMRQKKPDIKWNTLHKTRLTILYNTQDI